MQTPGMLKLGNRAVPVVNRGRRADNRERLNVKVREMANNLEFRRKWKRAAKIELWSDAAIFQLEDGSRWYLNIS